METEVTTQMAFITIKEIICVLEKLPPNNTVITEIKEIKTNEHKVFLIKNKEYFIELYPKEYAINKPFCLFIGKLTIHKLLCFLKSKKNLYLFIRNTSVFKMKYDEKSVTFYRRYID